MKYNQVFYSLLGMLLLLPLILFSRESAAQAAKGKGEDVQVIVIRPVKNEMKYETTEFTVKAGTKVKLIMENVADIEAMQHNVVILKPGSNIQEVGMAAITAGESKGYIPEHQAVMFYTAIAQAGEKTEVEFIAPPPGDYPYLCSFPGHFALMKGVMHSVE